jgi:hypothetical protein
MIHEKMSAKHKLLEYADMADMLGSGCVTIAGLSWTSAELREMAAAIP